MRGYATLVFPITAHPARRINPGHKVRVTGAQGAEAHLARVCPGNTPTSHRHFCDGLMRWNS